MHRNYLTISITVKLCNLPIYNVNCSDSCDSLGGILTKLDPTTVPSLPVEHGETVEVKCAKKHINTGGRVVRCFNGNMVIDDNDEYPSCRSIGRWPNGRLAPSVDNSH